MFLTTAQWLNSGQAQVNDFVIFCPGTDQGLECFIQGYMPGLGCLSICIQHTMQLSNSSFILLHVVFLLCKSKGWYKIILQILVFHLPKCQHSFRPHNLSNQCWPLSPSRQFLVDDTQVYNNFPILCTNNFLALKF